MDNTESNASQPPPVDHTAQAEQEASTQLDAQLKAIDDAKTSEQDKTNKLKDLGDALRIKAIEESEELNIIEEKNKNKPEKKPLIDAKKQRAVIDLRKMIIAAKKGIIVNHIPTNQVFIEHLAETGLEDYELINVFGILGDYIIGDGQITFSKPSEEMTDFEQRIMMIDMGDAFTGNKIKTSLTEMADLFGKDPIEIRKHFGRLTKIVGYRESQETEHVVHEFFRSFPEKQKDFVRALYEPKKYLELIQTERNEMMEHEENNHHLAEKIKKVYFREHKRQPNSSELAIMIERFVNIEVSEKIANNLTDVMNQLYRELNIAKSHKQFNEFESEDFMHGILTTRSTISRAMSNLNSTFEQMEEENPKFIESYGMYKLSEEDTEVREIDFKGSLRPVSKIKALSFHKKIKLSDFINNQISEFNHWKDKTGLFHDVGLAYGHPAHEGSFYKPIANAAEQITGVTLDSILSLPDGELSVEAFQLYNKMLQEETAKMDHRLATTTLQNKFNELSTQLEQEVIEYLKLHHGKEITSARIISAVNSAVGMGRAIFLTGPEMQAWVDPLTGTGKGTYFSSGTNDATSVNVFNPLYTPLRWGGPSHLRQYLFMEADGVEMTGKDFFKSLLGQGYDHRKSWDKSKEYMDSFFDKDRGREGSEKNNLVIDKILNLTKTASLYQRGGWRDATQFESHFSYDKNENLKLLDSFKSMDIIGYEAYNWFLKNMDTAVDLSDKTYGEKISGIEADQREELFKYIYEKYFQPLLPEPESGKTKQTYEEYIAKLRTKAEANVKKWVRENHTLHKDSKDNPEEKYIDTYEKAVQKEISNLFVKGSISREVALRFPTKFLRIDKDRLHKNGRSRWREIYEEMKEMKSSSDSDFDRNKFSRIMKDLEFAEGLLRYDTSKTVQENIHILPLEEYGTDRSLGREADALYNLNEASLVKLLRSTTMDEKRINDALTVYKLIKAKYIGDQEFLDGEAIMAIEDFPFSFGVENTDLRLIAYRASGPRPVARSINDVAAMEKVVDGFIQLPVLFVEIAKDGNYAPLIKYLQESQKTFRDVHSTGNDFEFNYLVAGMLINYMRKDQKADGYLGVGGVGTKNSIAAEIAGNSNLIREWDVRDIQQFILALQQVQLLPENNIDTAFGPQLEKIWKMDELTDLPKDTGQTKQKEVYKHTVDRLMKRFGGDWKNVLSKVLTELLPLALVWLLWQYIKKAFEEMMGSKKG